MSEHPATIRWQRTSDDFGYDNFNRDHELDFGHGVRVPASSAPDYLGTPERVDPEQAFVAALSSCHMLTFLALPRHSKELAPLPLSIKNIKRD